LKVHKTVDQAAKHLGEAASVIPARYEEGTSKAQWAEGAASPQAETNYQAGIQESISENRRQKGVEKAGNTSYRKGCAEKGKQVIGQRITNSLGKYRENVRPSMDAAIAASDAAPPKTRDPMQNIENRLKPVVAAQIAAKRAR